MGDLVKVSVDVDGPLRGIRALRDQSLPFVIARSLTMTAQDAQTVVRQFEKGGVFNIRNDWTVRNTKITPATKEKMMAEVYTDTGNASHPDYLPRQQDGGEKVPVGGHRWLAIPTDYLFKYTSRKRVIPDNLRPRALLPANAQFGESYEGSFSSGAGAVKRVIGKKTLKKLGTAEFVAFVQKAKSGIQCIFVRHGGMSWHGGSRDAEPWYLLISHGHVKGVFPMTELVEKTVGAKFDANFTRAATEVAVNDALRGTGLSVKF